MTNIHVLSRDEGHTVRDTVASNASVLGHDHTARVAEAIDGSLSDNTKRAYATGWAAFEQWAGEHGYPVFPTTSEVLASFVVELEAQGYSPTTISVYSSAVLWKHGERADALRTAGLKATLKGLARRQRGYKASKARSLGADEVLALARACEATEGIGNRAGVRDKWVILAGASLGLRYSDLSNIRRCDVSKIPGKGYEVTIPFSKTDQEGQGVVLPVPYLPEPYAEVCAARATDALLALMPGEDAPTAPLLRGLYKGGRRWRAGVLSANAVRSMLIHRAYEAGLEELSALSNHSLRATYATGAYGAGYGEDRIAAVGRWASLKEMRGYDRASRWHNPASSWLADAFQ